VGIPFPIAEQTCRFAVQPTCLSDSSESSESEFVDLSPVDFTMVCITGSVEALVSVRCNFDGAEMRARLLIVECIGATPRGWDVGEIIESLHKLACDAHKIPKEMWEGPFAYNLDEPVEYKEHNCERIVHSESPLTPCSSS
jgi:hypothetical protein